MPHRRPASRHAHSLAAALLDQRSGGGSNPSPAWGAGTKTISVEEMAVVTPRGAEYLVPPQERLILVPARGAGRARR